MIGIAHISRAKWLGSSILVVCLSAACPSFAGQRSVSRASWLDDQTQAGASVSSDNDGQPQSLDKKSSATQLFPGNGRFTTVPKSRAAKPGASLSAGGGISLNFINTDVKDVAKAILGDFLKLNYEIAPNVQGTITIQTSQPVAQSDVLPILDRTLRLNNLALVFSNNIYHVMPLSDALHQSGAVTVVGESHESPGYGVEVVPLHYVGVQELQKILEPLAPSQAIVRADTSRNALVIEGSQAERETLISDIELFDTNWLKGMSFALYTPRYTDDQELAHELTQVIGGPDSPVGGIVRFVPIDRLNAVLAISPQPRYLDQLKEWIARLDRPGQGSDKQIYVYDVQHGRASDLAATLINALSVGSEGEKARRATPVQAPQPTPSFLNATTSLGTSGAPAPAASTTASPMAPVTSPEESVSGTAKTPLGPINITADETNNALVIVATPQQYKSLQTALAKLDAAPLQVLLEAAIAEVTLTKNLSFGVQYAFQSSNGTQTAILSHSSSSAIAPTFPGFAYTFAGKNIQIILNELEALTRVEVLSSPSLMVLNNQTATLQVGDQVPIITEQAISTLTTGAPLVNSVQYQNTGVILNVTPRVNRGGEVMMDISQEVSDVTNTTTSDIDSPTIEERKITSTVAVEDGQTIALGGLISKNSTHGKSGIPLIQDIPLLGNLFSTTSDQDQKTELMVLITPHVIDNMQKAQAITNELRHKLPEVQSLLEPNGL